MEVERGLTRKAKDNFSIVFAFLLIGVGLYTYRFFIRTNPAASLILFVSSTFSMFLIFSLWRRFTERYAPDIIFFSTQHKWARKLVAGGSFSYYEFKENIHKIGLFEPVSRFMSMMIAFIGLASTLAKIANIQPVSPVYDQASTFTWAFLILIIPVILTPIVPIIWAIEDLQLKSWNTKHKTNLQVSRRYKARFNSFIAVGTLSVAYGLSSDPNAELQQNINVFLQLLSTAVVVLVYPISVLTFLYYIYFRGTVIAKIRDRMTIPMAETKLIYRNIAGQILDADGNIISAKVHEGDLMEILDTLENEPTESPEEPKVRLFPRLRKKRDASDVETDNLEENQGPLQSAGKKISETGKNIAGSVNKFGKSLSDNTVGRVFKKKQEETPTSEIKKKKKSRGSATEGLWEKEPTKKKRKGGSATAGLWDDED